MPPDNNAKRQIDAEPTKDLFIFMLVRDIDLTRAILDLVDNSVDGARRTRADGNFTGLTIKLVINEQSFSISDNCGGMSIETAEKYAFRFGRPGGHAAEPNSIGQFGVGMKRSLFKLGSKFSVASKTTTSSFTVDVDVTEWKKTPDLWKFEFSSTDEETQRSQLEAGTSISVESLYDNISTNFSHPEFVSRLASEIRAAHAGALSKQLDIELNGSHLTADMIYLKSSQSISPARRNIDYQNGKAVHVKLYAGIDESDPQKAGWYLYCNGRMVLEADQSKSTGWGLASALPKMHNQYSEFRGYAFFDSEDTSKLPWNTTKTGVYTDSALYKAVLVEIIGISRPVIDFLNQKDKEKGQESRPLHQIAKQSVRVTIDDLPVSASFRFEKPPQVSGPTTRRIQYDADSSEIEIVKEQLGARSLKEIGELTFQHYLLTECV